MPLSAALLLLLAPPTVKKAPPRVVRPPQTVIPSPVGPPATSEEIEKWSGWKMGAPPISVPAYPYLFSEPLPTPGPEASDATVFRLKVFLLRRSESVGTPGLPRPLAAILDAQEEIRARKAVANLDLLVREVTGNRVRLETSISVDEDGLGQSEDAATYAGYRINGGKFDAEDGVDRGPFSGVLLLGPFLKEQVVTANGTPVAAVDLYHAGVDQLLDGGIGTTELERNLLAAWYRLVAQRAPVVLTGRPSTQEPAVGWGGKPNWFTPARRRALRPEGTITDDIEFTSAADLPPLVPGGAVRGPYIGPVGVWIEDDAERGPVLRYREGSIERGGGFRLPDLSPPPGKNLAFWMRHATRDPLALVSESGTVILGNGFELGPSIEVPTDGKWHRIVVKPSRGMTFAPPVGTAGTMRRDNPVVNVWLSDFEWTEDAPSPFVESEGGRRFREIATASPTELISALGSGDALLAYAALLHLDPATPGYEAAVTPLLNEINAVVAREAARRLGGLTSDSARAALKRALNFGPSEAVRQEAAYALAKTGDPSLIPTLAILLGRPNWRSRLASVEALSAFRQNNAIRFRLSATLQDNPEIRYTALRPARLDDPDERQKLLYAAINDPSDAVRILASEKLLDSPDEAIRAEGLRAIADDSSWVRRQMQMGLARRKDIAFREAILKGTGDANPEVRAAAARALGAVGLLNPTVAPALFNDAHPSVLAALSDEERAGRTTLPAATLALLRATPDPRIRRP